MLKFSRFQSYVTKDSKGKDTVMASSLVQDFVDYENLRGFFDRHQIGTIKSKADGFTLSPYTCFGPNELASFKRQVDTRIAKGETDLKWVENIEEKNKYNHMLYKGQKLVLQCNLFKVGRNFRARRVESNINSYHAIILDFDDYDPESPTYDRIKTAIKQYGYAAVIQSSFSHMTYKDGKLKHGWHVFLEPSRVVKKKEWRAVFASLQKQFGDMGAHVDPKTENPSRIYFGPYKNGNNDGKYWHWEYVEGNTVNIDEHASVGEAIASIRDFKRAEVRKYELEKNRASRGGESVLSKIKWGDFDAEGIFEHLGIIYGNVKPCSGLKDYEFTFRFECPGPHESGNYDDSGVCNFTPGEMPMIYCSHASCKVGSGEGSTTRFFEEHWANLPNELIREEGLSIKRKLKTKPQPLTDKLEDVEVEVVTEDTCFESELDLGQLKSDDILEIYRTNIKNIFVEAPTGGGKTTANMIYAIECLNKGEKVLYVCSTIAEMGQFEETMRKKASAEIQAMVSYHCAASPKIVDNARMVVTHHHYLLRAGMMDVYYPVVNWAANAVVIIDEADALMAQMAKIIPVSARVTKFNDGYTHYQSTCPSRTARRYQCDNCISCSRMPMQAFAQRIWTISLPKNGVSDYDMGNPEACNPLEYPGFSKANVINTRTVFESEIHELKLETLGRPQTHRHTRVLDPEEKLSYTSAMDWINTIVAESDDPTLVQTNDDLHSIFQEAFAKYKQEYLDSDAERDLSEPERLKKAISYANTEMNRAQRNDKLKSYPMHACGTKELHYVDSHVLKLVIGKAIRVRYSTGTMSDRKKKVLMNIHGENEITFTKISHNTFVPIENLTLVLVEETLTNTEIADIHIRRKEPATPTSNGMKIGKALIITPTVSQKTVLGTKATSAAMYDHEARRAAVTESYQGGKWDTLITYSRSPLGRGMNLGDFSTCIVDSSIYKPMYSYDFSDVMDLEHVQQEERNSFIAQNSGRILRRPMHIVDGVWTVVEKEECAWANDRVIVIHGVESLHGAKAILTKTWQSLVQNPINVIIIDERENLLEDYNVKRVRHIMEQHWAHIKVPKALPLEIPEQLYDMTYARACRACPKLKDFLNEEDHTRIADERKQLKKFKEHVDRYSDMKTVKERKDAVNWDRIRWKICHRIVTMYEAWFKEVEEFHSKLKYNGSN